MSNCVISATDEISCQPWEPASFDPAGRVQARTTPGRVALPTVEQIADIEEQARQEGFAAGHAEGRAAGLREAAAEADRLRTLTDAFSAALSQADEGISHQILDLSLDLARAMLKSSLAVRSELVLPLVREAVRYLPAMQQPALVCLHPDDAALVRQHMGDELARTGWQLTSDPLLERGGCRIETPGSQIDATLPTRWQRLATALGETSDWLA
ncbi:MAG: flagellar assembly protein FliH [Thiobacillus sp. 65-29]|nr:MAG: flagellar assembly protein FliH [Thiobacillus sp. 65-29]